MTICDSGQKKLCETLAELGPMLWFFKYFRQKIQRKNCHFWLKTKLNYAKFYHNIGFLRKTLFFAENWQKSQKIVIITSTPGDERKGHLARTSSVTSLPRSPQKIRKSFGSHSFKVSSSQICQFANDQLQIFTSFYFSSALKQIAKRQFNV
jgi:hypothetical protein